MKLEGLTSGYTYIGFCCLISGYTASERECVCMCIYTLYKHTHKVKVKVAPQVIPTGGCGGYPRF